MHPIGSDVLRTGMQMPSVMRRIESLLIAAQLRATIGLPIGLEKVGVILGYGGKPWLG